MQVLRVKVSLLPERDGHHTLAFAEVTFGNSHKPLMVVRPFGLIRLDGELWVKWPQKTDKKRGGYYLFAEAIDKKFRQMVEGAILRGYEKEVRR